jgi:hypothetical protein
MIDRRIQAAVDRLVRDGWNLQLAIQPVDLIVMIGFLQLALKHPSLTPLQRSDLHGIIGRISAGLVDREPALRQLVEQGMPAGLELPGRRLDG